MTIKVKMEETDPAKIAANRAFIHERMPDALGFIGDLHKMGMISGWRNVTTTGPIDQPFPNDDKFVSPCWDDLSGRGLAQKGK